MSLNLMSGIALTISIALAAATASALPDTSGSETFTEPNGTYTAIKSYEVFAPGNPSDPSPLAGNYTYVYTITNQMSSFICLLGFDLEAPLGSITDAGSIANT